MSKNEFIIHIPYVFEFLFITEITHPIVVKIVIPMSIMSKKTV